MTIHNMTNDKLILAYVKALKLNLNDDFLDLLYLEIEQRNIKYLLPKDLGNLN
jgi:hypothetical protein